MIDDKKSLEIAEDIQTVKKECWLNSVKALLLRDDLRECYYVEGQYVDPTIGFPIEHGWIETKDGTIYDPTLILFGSCQKNQYFAGVRYTYKETSNLRGTLPRIFRDRNATHQKQYAEATVAAYLACGIDIHALKNK